ncbi:MAG: MerR family transcriptional regulator [Candidatus Sericytochromatia bacterium]|nr:MerR family transcriptional regulator [Candidatus Sericytochromatia bacterium]
MTEHDVPIYSIKTVVALTGLPAETIRAWERRYSAISPHRSGGGHRMYRAADVDRLVRLRRAVGSGHAIGRIANLSDTELADLVVAPQRSDAQGAPAAATAAAPTVADRVLEAVHRFDQAAAARELEFAAALLPASRLVEEVVLPLLERIGRGWEDGRVGIAQEHIASNLLRGLLSTMMRLTEPRADAPLAVLATPPGDLHELGLLCVGLVLAGRGLRVTYLGAQVPAAELVEVARAVDARVVGLGLGIVNDPALVLGELDHLSAQLPVTTRIWLGGRGVAAIAVERLPPRCKVFRRIADAEREAGSLL